MDETLPSAPATEITKFVDDGQLSFKEQFTLNKEKNQKAVYLAALEGVRKAEFLSDAEEILVVVDAMIKSYGIPSPDQRELLERAFTKLSQVLAEEKARAKKIAPPESILSDAERKRPLTLLKSLQEQLKEQDPNLA